VCGSTSSGAAVSTVKRLVTRYRPARTLVEQSAHAQLVVVGSRGCGGFAGLLLGSVSYALSHHAGCPVAIVRPAAPSHALTGAERASAPAYTSALPTSACRGERCPRSTPERTVSDPDRFSFFLPRCFPVPRSPRNLRGARVGRAPAFGTGSGVAGLGDWDRNGRRDTDVRLLPVDRHAGSVGRSGRWGRQPRGAPLTG
jgi:Universal stress protein family